MALVESIDFTQMDVKDDIVAALTPELHVVYVPSLTDAISYEIQQNDSDCLSFWGASVLNGRTPFDATKMREYMDKWKGLRIHSGLANVLVCHVPQDVIDALVLKCNDQVVTTIEEE